MTAIAKVTAKGQTTIPREIRDALKVHPGDFLAWELLASGQVKIRKAEPLDLEYLRALERTLTEWNSPEDEEAYRDL